MNVEIILEGRLRKSPPRDKGIMSILESWRDRWFVLFRRRGEHDCGLFYYTGEDKRHCKGSINLNSVESITIEDDKYLPNLFVIVAQHKNKERKYMMLAGSDVERRKWVDHLVVACGLDDADANQPVPAPAVNTAQESPLPSASANSSNELKVQAAVNADLGRSSSTSNVASAAKVGASASQLTVSAPPIQPAKPVVPEKSTKRSMRIAPPEARVSGEFSVPSALPVGTASFNSGRISPVPPVSVSKTVIERSSTSESEYMNSARNQPVSAPPSAKSVAPKAYYEDDDESERNCYMNSPGVNKLREFDNTYMNSAEAADDDKDLYKLPPSHVVKVNSKGQFPADTSRHSASNDLQHDNTDYNITPKNTPSTPNSRQNEPDSLYNAPRTGTSSVYMQPKSAADTLYNVPQGGSVNREESSAMNSFDLTIKVEGETEFGFFESRDFASKLALTSPQNTTLAEPVGDYVNYVSDSKPDDGTYMNMGGVRKATEQQSKKDRAPSPTPVTKPTVAPKPSVPTPAKRPDSSAAQNKPAVSNLARSQTEASSSRKAGWMAARKQDVDVVDSNAPPLPSRIVVPITASVSFRRTKPAGFTHTYMSDKVTKNVRESFQHPKPAILAPPLEENPGMLNSSDED